MQKSANNRRPSGVKGLSIVSGQDTESPPGVSAGSSVSSSSDGRERFPVDEPLGVAMDRLLSPVLNLTDGGVDGKVGKKSFRGVAGEDNNESGVLPGVVLGVLVYWELPGLSSRVFLCFFIGELRVVDVGADVDSPIERNDMNDGQGTGARA